MQITIPGAEPVKGVKGEKETFSFSIPPLSTMTK